MNVGMLIDEQRGFLPAADPLDQLPLYFAPWEAAARELPKLLISGQVRARIESLPLLDASALSNDREIRRAMTILSFLGHAYVWGEANVVDRLPAVIAVPWHHVSELLGRPPILSYASYALENWRRLDGNRPIELGNICLLQNFLGGQDEEWFVLIHVAIEAKAGPALAAIIGAQKAVAENRSEKVANQLAIVARTIETMHAILLRMPERCDPYIYFHRVRPYIHGWSNHPSLPSGMFYEGVHAFAGTPQKFRGETGAQSSIVPSLDAALGIKHRTDMLYTYLMEMRDYMPPVHRAFIKAIETGPSLREYVIAHREHVPALTENYNAAVEALEGFRSTHLNYAHAYIIKQSRGGARNPNSVGTGGTPFGPYLKKHRDETTRGKIT
ncbi:MAG TPA: indoleamine 2,3-dioxygenase [Candidatus Binatia bacterium]|nr:indoleamine 2,3-dioxygenase [Candidatus Binatia bacterium]